MDTKKIETVLTTVTIDSKVDSGKIDVVVGESAKMDVVKAVNYIQSGKAEIEAGVTEVFNQVDNHVAEKTAEFDQNAQDKTNAFNSNAVNKTGDFNDNYTSKLNAFNQNAQDKTNAFDLNASDKTGDFNTNASNKTTDFNDNYTAKKALIDAEVAVAEGYSAEAKQWAIGEPSEPSEGSAKYWAEQASHSVPNDGQLDIQVNGSSVATFTANQSGNTTANIVVGSGLPSQTGNAGKFLSTDGTDASWQYSITDKGMYSAITQYYPGDVVLYYYDNTYRSYLCIQPALNETPYNEASSYWKPFDAPSKIRIQNDWGDKPILPFIANGSSGSTITGVMLTPGTTSTIANFPTINTSTGLLKAPSGIDGYSPDSAFGATAFSNDYSDLDNLPNYGAGLSYSSSSLQLLDQNGNNLGSAVTIKSTPDLDGVTIDTNSDDELEAIGTVNKNTAVGATAVKYDWIGTLAEYNSQNVETLHPEWVCYITDDVSGGTSVYTKTEVDNAISTALTTMLDSAFPVGSRYITEASTCPLATLIPNSTWVLTSQGRVLQGADSNHASGTTAEAGLPNITGQLGYLKQATASNYNNPINIKTGAFSSSFETTASPAQQCVTPSTTDADRSGVADFNASNSNSIYGNSTTVQPPAEFVNIFKRIA